MRKIITSILMIVGLQLFAQMGVGTTTPSDHAMLDVSATDKGLLVPRMDSSELSAYAIALLTANNTDDIGMLVFDKTSKKMVVWNGTGFDYLEAVDTSYASLTLTSDTPIEGKGGGVALATPMTLWGNKNFSNPSNTKVIYDGSHQRRFRYSISASIVRGVSGVGYEEVEFTMIKNGSFQTGRAFVSFDKANQAYVNLSMEGSEELSFGDTLEVFVKFTNAEFMVLKTVQINIW